MAKPIYFDRIEDYLTGQMTDSEARTFEQDAATDQQLAEELKLQRLEHDAMERMLEQELKNKMASTWAASPPANPFSEKQEGKVVQIGAKKNWRILRLAAVIAGVLLITVLLWRLTSNQTNEMVNEPQNNESPAEPPIEETPPLTPKEETEIVDKPEEPINKKTTPQPETKQPEKPAPPTSGNTYLALANDAYQTPSDFASGVRSGETSTEKSALLQAAEAFDAGLYKKTLDLLGPPAVGDQSTVRYLRGHAYFNTRKYKEAAGQFQPMSDDELMPYHQESQWYLLLSYLAQLPKTEKDFRSLATQLSEDKYSDYQQAAKRLLEKVN